MSSLESQIDGLYQAPLAEFTAARNALARTLSKTEAARVKKLAKPTAVPWAINQLYWKARPTWDRLLKSGEKLRAVQLATLKGRAGDLREAGEAHRRAVSDAAKAAERVASQAGASAPPADALMRALEALSLMSEPPKPPGRLTEAPRPAGFEALTGVPVKPLAPVLRIQPDPKKEAQKKRQEEAAAKKAAAAARKREAEIKKAEAAIAAARAKLAKLKSG